MAVTPFDHAFTFQIDESADRATAAPVAVPAGKVLIIRYVSGNFSFPSGETHIVSVSLLYEGSTASVEHRLIPVPTGAMDVEDTVGVAQHTHLLIGSGVDVRVSAIRSPISGGVFGVVTISGELVDA
jgi:hypothetical protein